jgi:hypothetical protein
VSQAVSGTINVASGFGNKTEEAGAGKKVAVVTNGVDLPARIRHVRRRILRVGNIHFLVHRRFIDQHQHRLRPVDAGAASMASLLKPRRKNVASAKVSAIRREKKPSGIAKISAGAA